MSDFTSKTNPERSSPRKASRPDHAEGEHRLEAVDTSSLDRVGVTSARPVRVASWMHGTGPFRDVEPDSPEYPGWHYGSPVFCPDTQDHRPHDHAHFEVCIVRRGVAAHETALGAEELDAGTVVVMAPGMVHSIHGLHDLHQTNLYYLTEWIADDLMTHWREAGLVPLFLAAALFRRPQAELVTTFKLTDEEMEAIDRELADITRESASKFPSLTFLKSALLKVLIRLSRACVRQSPVEVGLGFRDEVVSALEHIEVLIKKSEPFHVADLARRLDTNPDYFSAIFRESTGLSPMAYYQRRRAQHASIELLDLRRSITEIAHGMGYCDSAHFSRLFKLHQGVTPNAYRGLYTVLEGEKRPLWWRGKQSKGGRDAEPTAGA
ncbi:MAG: AraC family transcriptional regulator [Candidatus Hydrogenedentes bacterium]|nr:AraC family transcriptional regulator [Candidatus Hydrogenedentota bacterium]